MASNVEEAVSFKTSTREDDVISSNWNRQAAGNESVTKGKDRIQISNANNCIIRMPVDRHQSILPL